MLLCASAAFASPEMGSPLRVDAKNSTAVMTALTLDDAGYQALRGLSSVTLESFVLGEGISVDLELARRDSYSADAQLVAMTDEGEVEMARPEVSLFGGHVAGDADSMVFLSFSPYGVEGFIESMGQTWIVSSGPFDQDLPIAVYNLTTLPEGVINWAEWECAALQLGQEFAPIDEQPMGGGQRGGDCFLLEFAVETDQEFLGLFGGDQTAANTYIATLFGAVGEIYTRDFFAEVEVVWSRLWTTTDPWNQGGSSNQLFQYRDYWEANMGSVHRDLGHYLSGRGLGGGVAWLDAVCTDSNYGLSGNLSGFFPYPIQDNHPQNWDLMVVAHEGGHNVGAPHTHDMGIDNCGGGDCSVTPFGTIMSYCHLCPGGMANMVMEFHPGSINNAILPFLNSLDCDIEGTCDGLEFALPGGVPTLVAPDGSTTVEVVVSGVGTVSPVASTGLLHYDLGGGFVSVPMSEGPPNSYAAAIPGADCGETVEFYFSAVGSDGETYLEPRSGVYSALTAFGLDSVFLDNFESDLGWSTSGTTGVGQWDRGIPANGNRGEPSDDFDGSGRCYLTGNSSQEDIDSGSVVLTSPVMDATMPDAILGYARWYSNTFGDAPRQDIFVVEVSNNGGASWQNLETVGPSGSEVSGGWNYKTFAISDVFATPSNQFRVRFTASDLNAGSVVEAAVDAIEIFAFDCGDPCPADRNGDGSLDFFDIQDFLNDFTAQDASADMNSDGSWDFFDVQSYLNLFSDGCP